MFLFKKYTSSDVDESCLRVDHAAHEAFHPPAMPVVAVPCPHLEADPAVYHARAAVDRHKPVRGFSLEDFGAEVALVAEQVSVKVSVDVVNAVDVADGTILQQNEKVHTKIGLTSYPHR